MRSLPMVLMVLMAVGLLTTATASAEPRTYPPTATLLRDPLTSPYRVHVARMGRGAIDPSDSTERTIGHEVEVADELPVAGETADRVRVVIDYDRARFLLWLDIRDLAWTVLRPVRLAGRGDVGVWLTTGAPVTASAGARRRTVQYRDLSVSVRGTVAADALGRVFPATVEVARRGGHTVRELYVEPGGARLHRGDLEVEILEARGAWTLVEYRDRYVRLRGWARTVEQGLGLLSGTGGGSAYGMSDTAQIEVPAGACMYDRAGGELVGLQLKDSKRYVAEQAGAWRAVYVGSAWGLDQVWVHAAPDASGGPPTWDRCDAPPAPAP